MALTSELSQSDVPQSIELEDNAAYSSVLNTQSVPHSLSLAVNDNHEACGATKETTDEIIYTTKIFNTRYCA